MKKHSLNTKWSLAWIWLVALCCCVTLAAMPDWSVVNYPLYTGVMARVKINGVPIHSQGSLLAAFHGDEVRGVAAIRGATQEEDLDGEYYFDLMIGSEDASEKGFTFKLWNSADDKIYEIDKTLDFDVNYPAKPGIYGGFSAGGFVPIVMNAIQNDPINQKYSLNIPNGTAKVNGVVVTEAAPGDIVTITANPPSTSHALKVWSTDDVSEFTGSILGATTTFVMPARQVTVTPSFVTKSSMPAVAVRSTTNTGDDTAKEPESPTVGATNKGKFTFTRTMPTGMTGALTVLFSIRGTAENGVDYSTIPSSVTFASGKSSVAVDITPLFDGTTEGDETVEVVLDIDPTAPTQTYRGGAVTDATVTIEDTVVDPDPGPDPDQKYTLTVTGGKIESTSTIGTSTFGKFSPGEEITITATLPSNQGLKVWTPSKDVEFIGSRLAATTTIKMPAYDVTVAASFVVKSSMPAVSVRSTTTAGDDTAKEPESASALATDKGKFTFTRTSANQSKALTVHYSIRGTAENGADYRTIASSVTFAANATSVSVDIVPLFDGATEGDETVEVILEPESGTQTYRGGTYTDATVTIEDTEPDNPPADLPTVQYMLYPPAAVAAGAQWKIDNGDWNDSEEIVTTTGGSHTITFKDVAGYITPEPQNLDLPVGVETFTNASATYEPNPTPQEYTLTVTGGKINGTSASGKFAPGEVVTIVATLPSNQGLKVWTPSKDVEFIGSRLAATTTIKMPAYDVTVAASFVTKSTMPAVSVRSTTNTGDDTAKEPSSSTAAADKGKFTFTRTTVNQSKALTVHYSVRGTAENGVDYKTIASSVTFAANSTSVAVEIEPLFDGATEGDETVEVVLEPESGTQTYRGGTYTHATVTIEDTVRPGPIEKYIVTVVNGRVVNSTAATAQFAADASVTITADAPAEGKAFDKWTSDDVTITDATFPTVTFTMPAKNVTVIATYKDELDPENEPYHPADTNQDYVISGTEYLQYAGPAKAIALSNYEYDWNGSDILSLVVANSTGSIQPTPPRGAGSGGAGDCSGDEFDVAIRRQVIQKAYIPGSTIEVDLLIFGNEKMTNLFVGEKIPEGWTVVGTAANYVMDGVLRMTWDAPDIPESFTYTIKAPSANLADSYVIASSAEDTACFTDELMLLDVADTELLNRYHYHPADRINRDRKISGAEYLKYVGPVKAAALGNYEYTWDGSDVISIRPKNATRGGAADDVAISRRVDTTTYAANSLVNVTLTIGGADGMVSLFVGETIPEGWTVVGDYAGNVRNGVLRMTWDAPNIPNTVTYTLQAPAGQPAASCQIASRSVDTACFTDHVVFLTAGNTVLTLGSQPAEWPEDMALYAPADNRNFREAYNLAVTFSWPAILEAESYRLVVAAYDGAVVFDETVDETACTVRGLEQGSYIWNVTAVGDDCIAGTSGDFRFAVLPDSPAPIIVGAVADGTAVRLAFDTADAGYADGEITYQVFFYSMDNGMRTFLTQTPVVAGGQAVIDLGVKASNGYLYIRPLTTPESSFTELYIK